MREMDWVTKRITDEGFDVPPELKKIFANKERRQSPFYFLDKADGLEEIASLKKQFPSRRVIPFARRADYDGVVSLILSDPVFKRGQVIVLHDTARPGTEVDAEFVSLSAWAQSAEAEISERKLSTSASPPG